MTTGDGGQGAKSSRPRPPRGELLAEAKRLLEDGASYKEVARTVRLSRRTLPRELPGFEANGVEFNSVLAAIKHDRALLAMHQQVWRMNVPE